LAHAFLKPDPNRLHVNHIDGNGHNNSLDNLQWCTPGENELHSNAVLKCKGGELHYNAKLTNKQVKQFRVEYSHGSKPAIQVAKEAKIHIRTAYKILNGETYKYV